MFVVDPNAVAGQCPPVTGSNGTDVPVPTTTAKTPSDSATLARCQHSIVVYAVFAFVVSRLELICYF